MFPVVSFGPTYSFLCAHESYWLLLLQSRFTHSCNTMLHVHVCVASCCVCFHALASLKINVLFSVYVHFDILFLSDLTDKPKVKRTRRKIGTTKSAINEGKGCMMCGKDTLYSKVSLNGSGSYGLCTWKHLPC